MAMTSRAPSSSAAKARPPAARRAELTSGSRWLMREAAGPLAGLNIPGMPKF